MKNLKIKTKLIILSSGFIVGILSTVNTIINEQWSKNTFLSLIILLSVLVISILLAQRVIHSIIKPIYIVSSHIDLLSKKDFSIRINDDLMIRKDELGDISNKIDILQSAINQLLFVSLMQSENVTESSDKINENVSFLTNELEEISATSEEISAISEETAATTNVVSNNATDVKNAIVSVANMAQDAATSISEIKDRATLVKNTSINSKKAASKIYKDTQEKLKDSIEKSKAVEEINVLSDAILQISSKTNLLALNATIEAASAGQAGRGFSVVANEIKKLAEDSKNTVSKIQEITRTVQDSVMNLSNNAEQILNFVDSTVINDYNLMVETSNQYSTDVVFMDDIVSNFSAVSQEVSSTIQDMSTSFEQISISSDETANGITNITDRNTAVFDKSHKMSIESNNLKKYSNTLQKSLSNFNFGEIVVWNYSVSVNNFDMDEHHRNLFSLINQIFKSLKQKSSNDVVIQLFKELKDYTMYHFSEEEKFMERLSFPELAIQKEAHSKFLKQVDEYVNSFVSGEKIGAEIAVTLYDWLNTHIAIMDKKYADYK